MRRIEEEGRDMYDRIWMRKIEEEGRESEGRVGCVGEKNEEGKDIWERADE